MRSDAESGLNLNLHKAVFLVDKLTNNILKDNNIRITNAQYLILKALSLHQGTKQSEISKVLGLSNSAISKQIFRLERMKLVKFEMDKKDRRLNYVVLTKEGKAEFKRAYKVTKIQLDKVLKNCLGTKGVSFKSNLRNFAKFLENG